MKIVYGTTNKSKIEFMRKRAEPLGIEILSLADVWGQSPSAWDSPLEIGSSPLENARIKARSYHAKLGGLVFAADSGLYIDGLEDARQPGINVRGEGDWMTDDDAIAHYAALAKEFGGKMRAQYKNAICLIRADGVMHEHMGDDIASKPFYLVDKPHEIRKTGFPLDSLSVNIATGKYYYDLENDSEYEDDFHDGFTDFFKRTLGL